MAKARKPRQAAFMHSGSTLVTLSRNEGLSLYHFPTMDLRAKLLPSLTSSPLERVTFRSFAVTRNSTPCTLRPTPQTLHPTPYTLHPTPFMLHLTPVPYTLHPTPFTPYIHYTLHSTPYTPHPTPLSRIPNPESRSRIPNPESRIPNPESRNPKPHTLDPKRYTLHQVTPNRMHIIAATAERAAFVWHLPSGALVLSCSSLLLSSLELSDI